LHKQYLRDKNLNHRGVAQPGSAPALGAGSRRFKSSRPDHSSKYNSRLLIQAAVFVLAVYVGFVGYLRTNPDKNLDKKGRTFGMSLLSIQASRSNTHTEKMP
jgi:hypothetical protein